MPVDRSGLPHEYLDAISTGYFDLEVSQTFRSSITDEDHRDFELRAYGDILFTPLNGPVDTLDDEIVIGSICGWKLSWLEPAELPYWADGISQDVFDAMDWLVNYQKIVEPDWIGDSLCFIESVEIDQMWRGLGLALPSVATFIDLLRPGIVFCKAYPLDLPRMAPKQEAFRKSRALLRLWKQLGLEQWTEEPYLACREWECPEHLRARNIFDRLNKRTERRMV